MLAVMLPTVIETRIQGETATKTEAEMEALFAFDLSTAIGPAHTTLIASMFPRVALE